MTRRVRWPAWLLTAAVLVVGIGTTTIAALWFDDGVRRDRERQFDAAAERARGEVSERTNLGVENLAHLRNWFLINPGLTRGEFHQLTSLGFDANLYPGVQALSFAPLVPRDELEGFEASVQADLPETGEYPPFVIHPRTSKAESLPVTYVEPIAGNEAAFGFDLGSDPARRRAVEEARDSGAAIGTGPVRLVQEVADQIGFVLVSPVYDTGDIPATSPARRRHFRGVVTLVFRVGDMFSGVFGVNPGVDVEIYDLGSITGAPTALDDAGKPLLDTRPDSLVGPGRHVDGLHRDLDLSFGDRRWRMVFTPATGFLEGSRNLPWIVALLGGLLSLLLASVVHSTTRARGRAERRAIEMTAELRAAEQRAQSIIQGAPDAIVVVNGTGQIQRVNLATESLFGYRADELIGQAVEVLLPDDLGDVHRSHRARYLDAPRRREMGAEMELLGRRRDGTTFPVEVSLSPLIVADGSLEVIAAVRDVSERRGAQAALQDAYEYEREAAEQLREADELKRAFLNTISHELRTPLTAITGFTDLLMSIPLTTEQRDDYLRRVGRNAQSLGTLISELLAFAGLEQEDVLLNPMPVDLGAQARLVVDQLSPILGGHTVVIDAPDLVLALVDQVAFTRILTNLLTNVARYAPGGTTATISVLQHDDRAVLTVSDEGPGIPVDEQRRVFDQFFRGESALASRVPGTGIGLAVVSELVHRSGGAVRVSSTDAGGARFEVELRAASSPDVSAGGDGG